MKAIVIYFSRADENYFGGAMRYIDKGNTEVAAEYIAEITGAKLFKVERAVPYSRDYMTCIKEAQKEQRENARPAIKNTLGSIADYDVVFVGSPIYWGTMPQPLFTQLEQLDFAGKTVMPFTTHEGSGLGSVVSDLKDICAGAKVKSGLAINGSAVRGSKAQIEKWINNNL